MLMKKIHSKNRLTTRNLINVDGMNPECRIVLSDANGGICRRIARTQTVDRGLIALANF